MVATLTASVTQRRPRSAILHHCVAAAAAGAQRTDGTVQRCAALLLALTIQSASRISGQRAVDSTTCIAVGDVALIGFGFCSM